MVKNTDAKHDDTSIDNLLTRVFNGDPIPEEERVKLLEQVNFALSTVKVQECEVVHEDPYDFNSCLTHDQTTELDKDKCDHAGMSEIDWIDDREMKQRGRAVIAEEELEYLKFDLADIRALADSAVEGDSADEGKSEAMVPACKIFEILDRGL